MGKDFRKRLGASKNLNYFSHEFIIQNHGDIVTCIFMIFIVGLMFQITSPLASVFVIPSYNLTEIDYNSKIPALYTYGLKDIALVVFYSMGAVIFHAIIQEYVLDKMNKRLRLSKTKSTRFNDSGQLVVFFFVSSFWLLNIFKDGGYFQSLSFFWSEYPHVGLNFWTKMFFIVQLAYWFHSFPELYFQKVKKEEMSEKIQFALIYLCVVAFIYILNLSRIGLTLLFIDYFTNFLFHSARLLHFTGKSKTAKVAFSFYNLTFVIARFATVLLTVIVFWFGFMSNSVDVIDFETQNFNTQVTRVTIMTVVITLQVWLLWNFVSFQFRKKGDDSVPSNSYKSNKMKQQLKKVKNASSRETSDGEFQQMSSDDDNQVENTNGKVKAH